MAATLADLLANEALLAATEADHQSHVSASIYVAPLPADLKPALSM